MSTKAKYKILLVNSNLWKIYYKIINKHNNKNKMIKFKIFFM